jgi:hypothetical protein
MLQHKFVEFIPESIEEGILYISMEYCTAIHKCVCGCGNQVVTPISPTDWQLKFDGKSISLTPSIGNWNFDCQSHYWITKNEIKYAGKWDEQEIEKGRNLDRKRKDDFYTPQTMLVPGIVEVKPKSSWLKSLLRFLGAK